MSLLKPPRTAAQHSGRAGQRADAWWLGGIRGKRLRHAPSDPTPESLCIHRGAPCIRAEGSCLTPPPRATAPRVPGPRVRQAGGLSWPPPRSWRRPSRAGSYSGLCVPRGELHQCERPTFQMAQNAVGRRAQQGFSPKILRHAPRPALNRRPPASEPESPALCPQAPARGTRLKRHQGASRPGPLASRGASSLNACAMSLRASCGGSPASTMHFSSSRSSCTWPSG